VPCRERKKGRLSIYGTPEYAATVPSYTSRCCCCEGTTFQHAMVVAEIVHSTIERPRKSNAAKYVQEMRLTHRGML